MQERKILSPAKIFSVGTKVELTSFEDGLRNSWFTGKIIDPPRENSETTKHPKSRSSENGDNDVYLWFQYDTIVVDDNSSEGLKEYVPISILRPSADSAIRAYAKRSFQLNDPVEAFHQDAWWVGVIKKVKRNSIFEVFFEDPVDVKEFKKEDLRVHLEWIDGKWVLPDSKEEVVIDGTGNVPNTQGGQPVSSRKRKKAKQAPGHCNKKGYGNGNHVSESMLSPNQDIIGEIAGESTKKKRSGRPPRKSSIQKLITTPQGEQKTGDIGLNKDSVKQGTATEPDLLGARRKSFATDRALSPLVYFTKKRNFRAKRSDILDPHLAPPTDENQVTELNDGPNEVENDIDQQEFQTAPVSKLSEVHRTGDETNADTRGNDIQEASEIKGTGNETDAVKMSSDNNQALSGYVGTPNKDQRWPFIKKSGMWKTIDSLEIFSMIPQRPHFSPLKNYEESKREHLAIVMMMKFAYEADRIMSSPPADLRDTRLINDSLEGFKDLEPHGFNTTTFQDYLKQLLGEMDRERELQTKMEKLHGEIITCQAERTAANAEMSQLVEQRRSLEEKIESAKSVTKLKEEQLARLESEKASVSEEFKRMQLKFLERTPLSANPFADS